MSVWWLCAIVLASSFGAGVLGQLLVNWLQGRWPFRE